MPVGVTVTVIAVFAVPTVKAPLGAIPNQLAPAQLCKDVNAVTLVVLPAETLSVC
jgi:hypothetical protein